MLYIIVGMLFIVGWIVLKFALIFVSAKDRQEIDEMYKSFKPIKEDF